MSTYPYTGNEYSDKSDHIDRILAEHINDLQDEVATVESVITGGEENQVLKAGAEGKAEWGKGSGGFQAVSVTADWSDAGNAWSDIKTSTEMVGRSEGLDLAILFITIWEGTADPDDFGLLRIINENTRTWLHGMASYPSSGTVYIVGVEYDWEAGVPM